MKLDYWCDKMQQVRWEKLLLSARVGVWSGCSDNVYHRRVVLGHSVPCVGVGDFTTSLLHSFVLVAGLAVDGYIC